MVVFKFPSWFFMVPGWFLWFFMIPGWFSWFFMVPGRVFMVLDWFFMVFHGSRSVFHGFSWVFMVFHVNVFFKSVTYRPTLSKFRGGQLKKNTLYLTQRIVLCSVLM